MADVRSLRDQAQNMRLKAEGSRKNGMDASHAATEYSKAGDLTNARLSQDRAAGFEREATGFENQAMSLEQQASALEQQATSIDQQVNQLRRQIDNLEQQKKNLLGV